MYYINYMIWGGGEYRDKLIVLLFFIIKKHWEILRNIKKCLIVNRKNKLQLDIYNKIQITTDEYISP